MYSNYHDLSYKIVISAQVSYNTFSDKLDQDLYTQSTHSLYAKQEGERISFRRTKTLKELPTQDRTFHTQEAGGVP